VFVLEKSWSKSQRVWPKNIGPPSMMVPCTTLRSLNEFVSHNPDENRAQGPVLYCVPSMFDSLGVRVPLTT